MRNVLPLKNGQPRFLELDLPFRYEYWRDEKSNVTIGYRKCGAVSDLIYHVHRAVELIYVDSGCAELLIDDRIESMPAGTFVVISGLVPHDFRHGDSSSWLVLIPAQQVSAVTRELECATFQRPLQQDEDGSMLDSIRLLAAIINKTGIYRSISDASRKELQDSVVSLIIRTAVAVCGLTEKTSGSHLLLQAVEYMNRNFREPLRVPDIARALFCSQTTLSGGFGSTFGMSINEYLNRLRASEVRRLLSEFPEMTLDEAAERAGFGSLRTMHRVYREIYGCTPAGKNE